MFFKLFHFVLIPFIIIFSPILLANQVAIEGKYCKLGYDTSPEYISSFRLLKNNRLIKTYLAEGETGEDAPEHWKFWFEEPADLILAEEENITLLTDVPSEYMETIVIQGLPTGFYTVEYVTLFNQIEHVKFHVRDNQKTTVTICFDEINYDDIEYVSVIDFLKDGEYYTMGISFRSCGGDGQMNIRITNQSGKKYLLYKNKTIELTPEQITAIRHYEQELDIIKEYHGSCGSSSESKYSLVYSDKINLSTDFGCSHSWYGWSNLMNQLNLQ